MLKQEEALRWLATVFQEPPESLTPTTTKDELRGWDSLGVLMLLAELDEQFGIQVEEKELGQLTAVENILSLLERHGALAR